MSGEYEPKDSRNVTGAGTTPDGRWTAEQAEPPRAAGQQQQGQEMGQGGQQGGGSGQGQPGTFTGPSGGQAGDLGAGRSDQGMQSGSGQQDQFAGAGTGQSGYGQSGSTQMGGGSADQGRFGEQIREHMSVVDAEGTEIGKVDSCDGDRIKLTRNDSSDGQHHYIELTRVAGIEGDRVRLHDTGDEAFGTSGE